jgi:hypothetical protein
MRNVSRSNTSQDLQDLRQLSITVPMDKAAQLDRLFAEVQVRLPRSGDYTLEVHGTRVEVFGCGAALNKYAIGTPDKVESITVIGDTVVLEIEAQGFTSIVFHATPKHQPAPRSAPLASSGESRGYGSRASG